MKLLNWKVVLIISLVISVFMRVWMLDKVPYGITGDEAGYIYNSYSIWQTGHDITGKFLPLSFNAHSSESPVNVYLSAPFVGIFGLNLFSARIIYALGNAACVLILFFLIDALFKNKRIASLGALILSVSPWSIQIGRTASDTNFALFFYLLAISLFIIFVKQKKFLFSIVFFILAFYSYHATKIIFVVIIPVLIAFYFKDLKTRKIELVLYGVLYILTILSFLFVIKTQEVTRQNDVYIFNNPAVADVVNWEREYTTAPQATLSVFSNKPLVYLRNIREAFLEPFSLNYLFLYGETGLRAQLYNTYFRGAFYIIELPFLLIGLFMLIKKRGKNLAILASLMAISVLPSVFTIDRNYASRDILLLPILTIIIAYGLYEFLVYVSRKKILYKALIIVVIGIYAFLVAEFFNQYFFRWPVYGAEATDSSTREIVKLISDEKQNKKQVIVTTSSPKELLLVYVIDNSLDPRIVQKIWNNNPMSFENVTLSKKCLIEGKDGTLENFPKNTLYLTLHKACSYKTIKPTNFIKDRGQPLRKIWDIYLNN